MFRSRTSDCPRHCRPLLSSLSQKRLEIKGLQTCPRGAECENIVTAVYSAILRELTKGADSRFVKTERGKFARKA